jgi:hypothetical protein
MRLFVTATSLNALSVENIAVDAGVARTIAR